ncbi:MAG TPA: efflux RND transporter periplasmic adaptor subunit [Gemmataceae bacterium]|jgi:RND family efflux transporter MFP subunit
MRLLSPDRSVVFFFGSFLVTSISLGCGTPPAKEKTPPAPVKAEKGSTISYPEWTGLLGVTQPLPNMSARVSAPIEGRVLWVLGEGTSAEALERQPVEKNQILVKLDDRVARANRDKAAAAAEEMKEQEKQADYALELANLDVERLEKLKPTGANNGDIPLVSRIELEKARLALKDAESKKRGAIARQEANKAEVKALDEQLALYEIRSPLSGRLGMIQVVPGQTLSVGAPIADVVNLNELDVLCHVAPSMLSPLRLGLKAQLKDDDDFVGEVAFIAPIAQADTGNFAVKVRFENRELRLRVNMVIRIEVQTEAASERFAVPVSALLEDQDPPAVIVVAEKTTTNADGEPETILVARKLWAEIGVRGGDDEHPVVEIRNLRNEKKNPVPFRDLQYVTEGAQGLEDGDPIKIEEEEHKEDEPKKEK